MKSLRSHFEVFLKFSVLWRDNMFAVKIYNAKDKDYYFLEIDNQIKSFKSIKKGFEFMGNFNLEENEVFSICLI
jgi:hypothetical protein